MIKKCLIVLILVSNLSRLCASNEVEINVKKANDFPLMPGKTYTYVFELLNNTSDSIHVFLSTHLPEESSSIERDVSVRLKPGTSELVLYSIFFPSYMEAGKYEVFFRFSTKNGKLIDEKQIEAEVTITRDFSLSPLIMPDYIMSGDTIQSFILIKNSGNAQQEYSIKTSDHIMMNKKSIVVPAGLSIKVPFYIPTPDKLSRSYIEAMRISVYPKSLKDEVKTLTANYEVIPNKEKPDERFLKFPITVSTAYMGRSFSGGYLSRIQGELSGRGALSATGNTQLRFRFKGSDGSNMIQYGSQEEYYAELQTKRLHLLFGDNVYSLTPLTEYSRYARGFRMEYQIKNKYRTGIYYNQPRFFSEYSNITSAYFTYAPSEKNYLKIAYLHKNHTKEIQYSKLFSISGGAKLSKNTQFEAEVARGYHHKNKLGYAARLAFSSYFRFLTLNLRGLYADKYYPGYFQNTYQYAANISLRPTKHLMISSGIHQDAQNVKRDTLFYGKAPYTYRLFSVISYRFFKGLNVKIHGIMKESRDMMPQKAFHYEKKVLRIGVSGKVGDLNYNMFGEKGNTNNLLHQTKSQLSTASLNLNYTINKRLSITGWATYSNSNLFTGENTTQWYYGADFFSQIGQNSSVKFSFQNNHSIEELYREPSLFNLEYSKQTGKGDLSLIARSFMFKDQPDRKDMSFMIRYSHRIGVPIKKISEAGTVTGLITSALSISLGNIPISINGYSTITNEKGEFKFSNVKPGDYYLIADLSNTELNTTTTTPLPLKVRVHPDQNTNIAFRLTKSGTVSGTLILENEKGIEIALTNTGNEKQLQVIVEASNEFGEKYLRRTDESGQFEFQNLRPGSWTVKIFKNGLASCYKIEKYNYHVNLLPGEEININVHVKKKSKEIKFLQKNIFVTASRE